MRDGFCAALAEGVKVWAFGLEVYCGTCLPGRASSGGHRAPVPDWVPHRLRSQIDGARRVVYLPARAGVLAGPGQGIEAGEPWAEVLPPANREWRRRNAEHRWATADEPCGGSAGAASLLRLWFEQQVVWLAAEPNQVLVPADLIACAARELRPLGLWWDTAPALPHYGWELQAAVFPPVPLRHWAGLRLGLPGDLLLDAGAVDRRLSAGNFSVMPIWSLPRDHRRRKAPGA
jgi:hypothetical protein